VTPNRRLCYNLSRNRGNSPPLADAPTSRPHALRRQSHRRVTTDTEGSFPHDSPCPRSAWVGPAPSTYHALLTYVAIEALLLYPEDKASRLTARVAWLIGVNEADRKSYRQFMDAFGRLRGTVGHGNAPSLDVVSRLLDLSASDPRRAHAHRVARFCNRRLDRRIPLGLPLRPALLELATPPIEEPPQFR